MSIRRSRWPSFPLVHHTELVLRRCAGHILAADGAEVGAFSYDDIRAVRRRECVVGIRLAPNTAGVDTVILAARTETAAIALELALNERSGRPWHT